MLIDPTIATTTRPAAEPTEPTGDRIRDRPRREFDPAAGSANRLLAPWTPSADAPWDDAAAAHLLRRAAFGGSLREIRAAVELGPKETVRRLVAGEPLAGDDPRLEHAADIDSIASAAARAGIDRLRTWWVHRMLLSTAPLRERMMLMWHDHLATSNAKVNDPRLMLGQLRTIDAHALGSFRAMMQAIARDPAMIVWLDGNTNVNGRANENFARELFELFMLGVGHYSETDVREAARAFTGWHQRSGRFRFEARFHDDGRKSVLGHHGTFDGDEIIDLALEQPACGQFIGRRLCEEFITAQPSAALVVAVADELRDADFHLGDCMATILRSRAFMDPAIRHHRIKSPAELVIGFGRSLEMIPAGRDADRAISAMGQHLLEPPSVAGWDGHRAWLHPAAMLQRIRSLRLACGDSALPISRFLDAGSLRSAADVDAAVATITLDGRIPPGVERVLTGAFSRPAARMPQALAACVTVPEYQLA
ncbi:MAG: DUF1800 family protein [Phycisphaerales bacterium]